MRVARSLGRMGTTVVRVWKEKVVIVLWRKRGIYIG